MYVAEQQAAIAAATGARRRCRRRSSSATAICARSSTGGACRATSICTSTGACASPASSRPTRATQGADQITARGYLGGREYELRAGVGAAARRERRLRPRPHDRRARPTRCKHRRRAAVVALGQALGPEPLRRRLSRSLLALAHHRLRRRRLSPSPAAPTLTYTYDKIWGSVSASTARTSAATTTAGRSIPANASPARRHRGDAAHLDHLDRLRCASPRGSISSPISSSTPSGAAGAQLTRLDALATIRAGKHLTLRARLRSSVGVRHRDVADAPAQRPHRLTSPGTIENNLIVERTARDEGARATPTLSFGKVSIFAEGRFRQPRAGHAERRSAVPGRQRQLDHARPGLRRSPSGLRDRGSLAGIRAGLWGMLPQRLPLDAASSSASISGAAFSTIG